VNLYTTYPPADFLDYVNPPIGNGLPVPGPLKPVNRDSFHRRQEDAGRILAERITWFIQRLKLPNGLRDIGYSSSDIPALVEGTLPQHRVTKLSPRPAAPEQLSRLFEDALVAW
jgi:hypothetical protein